MSLAADILKRAAAMEAAAPVPPKPRPPVRKRKRKAVVHRTLFSHKDMHLARVPGVARYGDGWRAGLCEHGRQRKLGTHPTLPRALLAMRLARHWQKRGFSLLDIPATSRRTRFRFAD